MTIVTGRTRSVTIRLALASFFAFAGRSALADGGPESGAAYRILPDAGHPWRPPFGLDRVGMPPAVVVRASDRPTGTAYLLTVRRQGREIGRQSVRFPANPPYSVRVPIAGDADEVVLLDATRGAAPVELAREKVAVPALEADAVARAEPIVNPVDLGTILVPSGWLLLGPGQSATLDVAAISRDRDRPDVRLAAWYDSRPDTKASAAMGLPRVFASVDPSGSPTRCRASPAIPCRSCWKTATAMCSGASRSRPCSSRARRPGRVSVPRTRGSATTPRSRSAIRRREPTRPCPTKCAGRPTSTTSWSGCPTASRFVFWRGSSYIPFWAGRHNTGACYEWAEIISQPAGAVDCVEPLMDKELRYGRVAIVESTAARVHVRWTYQLTDRLYKVWGDAVVEDYFFYPDGFGTRVVNLKADPANNYELSEFIILTPPGAYPFAVLPDNPVDALFLDGRKHAFRFPNPTPGKDRPIDSGGVPAVYRLRLSKSDDIAAVYFNPNETKLPPVVFAPFFDKGEMVTPCYWGSHWPLARGNATGNAIDDRIGLTPCHNSVMSWAGTRPRPLRSAELMTLDTLGRSRPMTVRTWAWLIGMSGESDARLVARAKSFATPPALELRGARVGFDGYSPERRAIRLVAEAPEVAITIKPGSPCVNPVFEFEGVPKGAARVVLAGRVLDSSRYAWDGRTLWLDATIATPTELRVTFSDPD